MNDILEAVEKTKELAPRDRKAKLLSSADKSGISRIFLHLGDAHSDNRALLRALCDLCSGEKLRETICRNASIYRSRILSQLYSQDAKARKLAAELIGKVGPDLFFKELTAALENELTDFVKPSMILSFGHICEYKEDALSFLKKYEVTATEEKHRSEQTFALKKAISSLSGEQQAAILPLPSGTVLVLDCPSTQVTLKEVRSLGYDAKEARFPFNTILVYGVEKYRRIFAARSFYSASIFYGEYKDIKEVKTALCSCVFSDFLHTLFGEKELAFRLELKCEKGCEPASGRSKAAESLAKLADSSERGLCMSPSSYLFEIAINITAKGILLSVLPSKKLDDRFTYKKENVPASIHPAAAAACVSFIKKYTYPDADVLDCFCGSGTMLFERARLPYKSLTGSDISPFAVKASRINERAAKTGAKFFAKNAADPFREKYDEVICNMPFGLRVGSHMENKSLYKAFLANLSSILSERGRAFLFTNDKKLLTELLTDEYTLIGKHSFSCGGLYPAIFVVKKNKASV